MKGRKRHLLVDTNGLVIQAVVHTAGLHDREGGKPVLEALAPVKERFPRLKHVWVESGYRGRFVEWVPRAVGLECRSRAAPLGGLERGVGAARGGGRARADQTKGLPSLAEKVGGGTHVRMAQYRSAAVQGLRILAGK